MFRVHGSDGIYAPSSGNATSGDVFSTLSTLRLQ